MEVKTITVHPRTHRELMLLKQQLGVSSFDQLLSRMAKERAEKKSMFGAIKGIQAAYVRDHKDRV